MAYAPAIGGIDNKGSDSAAGAGIATDPIWTAADQLAYGVGAGIGSVFVMAPGTREFLSTAPTNATTFICSFF